MLILLGILACGSTGVIEEAAVVSDEEKTAVTPAPQTPVLDEPIPKEEAPVKEEAPPPEPEAVAPEPVLLNTLDPNVNLPIFRHKDSGCYVLVPTGQNDGSLNPVYQRIPTECPEEMMMPGWESCREGELRQIGERCECQVLVGRPPPPAIEVDCPQEEVTPEAENSEEAE